MSREQIVDIEFLETPDVRVRVIRDDDPKAIKEAKKTFPFELHNSLNVNILTDKRKFKFNILSVQGQITNI